MAGIHIPMAGIHIPMAGIHIFQGLTQYDFTNYAFIHKNMHAYTLTIQGLVPEQY